MIPFTRLLLPTAGMVLAGCGMLSRPMDVAPPDDLSAWSLVPLPPDPALAAEAVAEGHVCRMDDDPGDNDVPPVPQILVQDRRTQRSAAFLIKTEHNFGDCLYTRAGGGSGGWGPTLEAMDGVLTIEDRSSGQVGNDPVDVLGGRIAIPAAQVILELHDGRRMVASTGNGYWLTWRPAFNGAARLVALAADGTELASLAVPAN